MAGNIFVVNTTVEGALASSSELWLIRIAPPTSTVIKIKEWGVYFDGISPTAQPVQVMLKLGNTSDGSGTAHVPTKRSGRITVSQCHVETINTSSDPTIANVVAVRNVHPQSGYQEKFAYGDEITVLGSTGGSASCIYLMVNSATTMNAFAEIVYEE